MSIECNFSEGNYTSQARVCRTCIVLKVFSIQTLSLILDTRDHAIKLSAGLCLAYEKQMNAFLRACKHCYLIQIAILTCFWICHTCIFIILFF